MVAKSNGEFGHKYSVRAAPNGGKRRMTAVKAIAQAVKEHFGVRQSQAVSTAPEKVARIPVINDIYVIEVPPGTDYRNEPTHNPADFMCIDAHEFGVSEALEWTKNVNSLARSQKRRPPLIALLADDDKLNQRDYRLATKEFSRAGGFFYEYPAGCKSFIDALKAFARGLAKNYRAPIAHRK